MSMTDEKKTDDVVVEEAPKEPAKKVTRKAPTKKVEEQPVYEGPSVVEYLKSIGMSASFATRKRLAAKHGLPVYAGTQAHNEALLKALRAAR